jgi:hypothetical protein
MPLASRSSSGSCGAFRRVPGPRDRAYSKYLLRENPWLQLQQVAEFCLDVRHDPIGPKSASLQNDAMGHSRTHAP